VSTVRPLDTTVAPVADAEGLTPAWVSAALGRPVHSLERTVVGTGQMGTCYRLLLTGDPQLPASVLVKLPSADAGMREMVAGSYAAEVRFYRELAATVEIRVPLTYYARIADKGVFTLVMEDLAPSIPGDQITGCTPEQAAHAVRNLAGLHGPRWCDPALLEAEGLSLNDEDGAAGVQQTLPSSAELTIEVLGDAIDPRDAATFREACAVTGRWLLGRPERFGLVHGDYRLDNLLFPPDQPGVHAVDWQGVSLGLPARDVAYFLGTGLSVADRRTHERDLVALYHDALLGYGVDDHSPQECWDDYRFGMLQTTLITAYGCAYGARSERGDRMFAAMLERACAAIRDLDTLSLVG
jgi:hypothetical protein